MKKHDILKAANEVVAEYMAKGYLICWMGASFAYEFRVDLEKNDKFIRVKVAYFYDSVEKPYTRYEGLELSVVRIDNADAFEDKEKEPIYTKRFYCVNETAKSDKCWYVETMDEAAAIYRIQCDRYISKRKKWDLQLNPTKALIQKMKSHKGFSRASSKTIKVFRKADGYHVSIIGRTGLVSNTKIFKVGKDK